MKRNKDSDLTIKGLFESVDEYNKINSKLIVNRLHCMEFSNTGMTDYRITYIGKGLKDFSNPSILRYYNIYEVEKFVTVTGKNPVRANPKSCFLQVTSDGIEVYGMFEVPQIEIELKDNQFYKVERFKERYYSKTLQFAIFLQEFKKGDKNIENITIKDIYEKVQDTLSNNSYCKKKYKNAFAYSFIYWICKNSNIEKVSTLYDSLIFSNDSKNIIDILDKIVQDDYFTHNCSEEFLFRKDKQLDSYIQELIELKDFKELLKKVDTNILFKDEDDGE